MNLDRDSASRNARFHARYTLDQYYTRYVAQPHQVYEFLHHYRELQTLVRLSTGRKRVLLLGLGFGRELDILLKVMDAPFITVLDINRNFINAGRRIYSASSVEFVEQDLNDITELTFDSGTFDLAIALNTVEYIVDDEKFGITIRECARVLKKGGMFFFRLLNLSHPFAFITVRGLKRRNQAQPVYKLRRFADVKQMVSSSFGSNSEFRNDFAVPFGRLDFLYHDSVAYLAYRLGLGLARMLPISMSKSVYFIAER